MATVLQRVKQRRLTPAQECESRLAFALVTDGRADMSGKELKLCLRALGFSVAKGEAQALVYEFDYDDTATVSLPDFQKIFLAKVLEKGECELFDQAFRSMDRDSTGEISIRDLSVCLHATKHECAEPTDTDTDVDDSKTPLDGNLLARYIRAQSDDDGVTVAGRDAAASMRPSVGEVEEMRVPKAMLAAFLRLQ